MSHAKCRAKKQKVNTEYHTETAETIGLSYVCMSTIAFKNQCMGKSNPS